MIPFSHVFQMEESDAPAISDTAVAVLSAVTGAADPISLTAASFSIILEDNLVMTDIPNFSDAFAYLFGLIYALHLDYPKRLTNTFTFIQKVLMGLDDGFPLKPALLSLQNDLKE